MAKPNSGNSLFELRSGVTIFHSHDQAIDHLIAEMVEKIPAQFVLVASVVGELVSTSGERGRANLVALSSLIAGDFAAGREISRLTNEADNHQLTLREGVNTHAFIIEAGPHLILFAQVSNHVPLGWARLFIQSAARRLEEIINTPPEIVMPLELNVPQGELAREADQALDGLWAG